MVSGCLIAALASVTAVEAMETGPATDNNVHPATHSVRQVHHDAPVNDLDKRSKIASEVPLSAPLLPAQDPLPKPKGNLISATTEIIVKAPLTFVWQTLTDFSGYPQVFKSVETCKVTKQTGNYVYTESNLKPQLFLRQTHQTCVNDLTGKPHVLRWAVLKGNFGSSQGCWELSPETNGKYCKVRYTLESTTDPVPKAIAGVTLKYVQKDIVKQFKKTTERLYMNRQAQAGSIAVSP